MKICLNGYVLMLNNNSFYSCYAIVSLYEFLIRIPLVLFFSLLAQVARRAVFASFGIKPFLFSFFLSRLTQSAPSVVLLYTGVTEGEPIPTTLLTSC